MSEIPFEFFVQQPGDLISPLSLVPGRNSVVVDRRTSHNRSSPWNGTDALPFVFVFTTLSSTTVCNVLRCGHRRVISELDERLCVFSVEQRRPFFKTHAYRHACYSLRTRIFLFFLLSSTITQGSMEYSRETLYITRDSLRRDNYRDARE